MCVFSFRIISDASTAFQFTFRFNLRCFCLLVTAFFDTMSSDYNVCCGEVQDIIQDADCLYQQLLELALLPSSYDFSFTWYLIRSLYKLLTDRKKQYNPKLRSVLIPFT